MFVFLIQRLADVNISFLFKDSSALVYHDCRYSSKPLLGFTNLWEQTARRYTGDMAVRPMIATPAGDASFLAQPICEQVKRSGAEAKAAFHQ
jgi:hypothetical protein